MIDYTDVKSSIYYLSVLLYFTGYYCPQGQTVRNPSPYECPAGYYCPTGSSVQTLCPAGTYQDEVGQSVCKECPEGFYCDSSLGPIVNYTIYVCPEGLLQDTTLIYPQLINFIKGNIKIYPDTSTFS